jgi:hypothetical protein
MRCRQRPRQQSTPRRQRCTAGARSVALSDTGRGVARAAIKDQQDKAAQAEQTAKARENELAPSFVKRSVPTRRAPRAEYMVKFSQGGGIGLPGEAQVATYGNNNIVYK